MRGILIAGAAVLGALSSLVWYVPGAMDARTAALASGMLAILAGISAARLIDVLQRGR